MQISFPTERALAQDFPLNDATSIASAKRRKLDLGRGSVSPRRLAFLSRAQARNFFQRECENGVVIPVRNVALAVAGILSLATTGQCRIPGTKATTMPKWKALDVETFQNEMAEFEARTLAGKFDDEIDEAMLIEALHYWDGKSRKRIRAGISKLLGVTAVKRKAADVRNLDATDETKAQRATRRLAENAARKAAKRKAKGATPRAQSLSQTKPWEALRMSRAAWYRMAKVGAAKSNGQAHVETVSGAVETVSGATHTKYHRAAPEMEAPGPSGRCYEAATMPIKPPASQEPCDKTDFVKVVRFPVASPEKYAAALASARATSIPKDVLAKIREAMAIAVARVARAA